MSATTAPLLAAADAAANDQGNLTVGLVIGVVAVIVATWSLIHRYHVSRRRAATRDEHEMLREVNGQRPEQKAVQDQTTVNYLRRRGI